MYLDDIAINSEGSYATSTWLTGTPPTTIAGGDSGNISLTFNASSFSSDTSLSATVSVYNNDPQDTLKTFAATMNVRADTAIFTMGLAGKTLYHTPVAAGDTSRKYTINIQNTGVRSLVIDSAVYVGGQNSKFFNTMLSTPETIPQMSTKSFNTYFSSAQTGQYIDTLKIYQSSTDSTGSGASIPRGSFAYGVMDTLNDFTSSNTFSTSIPNSWTKGSYIYLSLIHI